MGKDALAGLWMSENQETECLDIQAWRQTGLKLPLVGTTAEDLAKMCRSGIYKSRNKSFWIKQFLFYMSETQRGRCLYYNMTRGFWGPVDCRNDKQ